MGSWRDQILSEFTPQVARLTLVADPDGLLLEEGVLEGIRERGFELIPFEDPVPFRYAYESKFRSRWDRGEETDLVVVLRSPSSDLDALFEAQAKHVPGQLGDNATKEFGPRHVFEIVPELIKQPSDLLRVSLHRHYRGMRIPAILDERFIQVLRQNGLFEDWPLETIIPDA